MTGKSCVSSEVYACESLEQHWGLALPRIRKMIRERVASDRIMAAFKHLVKTKVFYFSLFVFFFVLPLVLIRCFFFIPLFFHPSLSLLVRCLQDPRVLSRLVRPHPPHRHREGLEPPAHLLLRAHGIVQGVHEVGGEGGGIKEFLRGC